MRLSSKITNIDNRRLWRQGERLMRSAVVCLIVVLNGVGIAYGADYWLDKSMSGIMRRIETQATQIRSDIYIAPDKDSELALRKRLRQLYYDQPKEESLLNLELEEAIHNKASKERKSEIYHQLTRNSFNRENYKEAMEYAKKLREMSSVGDKSYFTAMYYIAMVKLMQEQYRDSWREVLEIDHIANVHESYYGVLVGEAVKGQAYYVASQPDSAQMCFTNGYQFQAKSRSHTWDLEFAFLAAYSSLRVSEFDFAENAFKRYSTAIRYGNSSGNKAYNQPKFRWVSNMMNLAICLSKGKIAEAERYNERLWREDVGYVPCPMLLTSAVYCHAKLMTALKKYDSALEDLNNVIERDSSRLSHYLHEKAKIMDAMGEHGAAFAQYEKTAKMLDKRRTDNFSRELLQLEAATDDFNREEELQQMRLTSGRVIRNVLIASVAVLGIVLLVLIVMMVRNLLASQKLKKKTEELLATSEDLRNTSEQLGQAIAEEEVSYQKKAKFVGDISHEIRTPLNAIVGFSDLLASMVESQGGDETEYVSVIRSNSDMMLRLVDEVMNKSRKQQALVDVKLAPDNVVLCARAAMKSVDVLMPEGVEARLVCDKESIVINTDILRLQQLLNNLLTNAVKFTKQGFVELAVKQEDDYVVFTVTDTGCGISEEYQDSVFNKFERGNVDSSVTGIGLGLYVSKLISNELLGSLYIDKEYTGGTRFVFEHPMHLSARSYQEIMNNADA